MGVFLFGFLENSYYLCAGEKNVIMKQKPSGYWTYERCYEEAKKYSTRQSFSRNASGAYHASKKNGWLDEFFPQKNYTYAECKNIAEQSSTKSYMNKHYHQAYKVSKVNGWIDEFFPAVKKDKSDRKITYESCFDAAKECTTIKEFLTRYPSKYAVSCKKGWRKDFVWLQNTPSKVSKWDTKKCTEEAKKYKTKEAFKNACISAYLYAQRNGIMKSFYWLYKSNTKWTYEKCLEIVSDCKTKGEFRSKNKSAYNAARRFGFIDKLFNE